MTFSVTVSAVAPGGGTVAGFVTFRSENGILGSGSVGAGGVATFSTASVAVGTHTITASYVGNANYQSSNDFSSATPLVQTVNPATTSMVT